MCWALLCVYRAIDLLKESNVSGINDAMIGHLYMTYIHEPEKAAEYLTKAYTSVLRDYTGRSIYPGTHCLRADPQPFHPAGG